MNVVDRGDGGPIEGDAVLGRQPNQILD